MTQICSFYELMPAGYLIVRQADDLRSTDAYHRQFGPYYGVDRRPPFLAPDDAIREVLGIAPIPEGEFKRALTEWYETQISSTAFIPSYSRALRWLKALQSQGVRLELLYCDLALAAGAAGELQGRCEPA